jgi:hypothetical protein
MAKPPPLADHFSRQPPLHNAERAGVSPALSAVPAPDEKRSFSSEPEAYIMSMPPMPPGMPAPADCFSGASATTASVVRMFFAIEAAF